MRTEFTPESLNDPNIAEADAILRSCVHCGFCTATCPTYVIGGDERDSPRGRIYLMKEMFERGGEPGEAVTTHVDRCLSCLSCMTTCPSGVDYMRLVDLARARIEPSARRSIGQKLARELATRVMPYPRRFRWAIRAARLAQPFEPLLEKFGLGELASMLALAPKRVRRVGALRPGIYPAQGRAQMTVGLMNGCVGPEVRPEIDDATIRVLNRHGINVVLANGQGCCGALPHHIGREEAALELARRHVDAWHEVLKKRTLDAIAVNVSGCGTTLKDYGRLLGRDPAYAAKAKRVAGLVKDVTEVLARLGSLQVERWSGLRVAYHSACSLGHGQRVTAEPRSLLRRAGFEVLEVPDGHLCCGSAGVYNVLQPGYARELKARKQNAIRGLRADVVAAGNIGCLTQLEAGLDTPIVHTVELLDWATGGPCPPALRPFDGEANWIRRERASAA